MQECTTTSKRPLIVEQHFDGSPHSYPTENEQAFFDYRLFDHEWVRNEYAPQRSCLIICKRPISHALSG